MNRKYTGQNAMDNWEKYEKCVRTDTELGAVIELLRAALHLQNISVHISDRLFNNSIPKGSFPLVDSLQPLTEIPIDTHFIPLLLLPFMRFFLAQRSAAQ